MTGTMAASYRLFFNLILLFSTVSVCFCGVPVLLWESSAITAKEDVVPALMQLDSDEFSNHLVKKVHVHKPLIAVFLEESLSMEDFSWGGSFPQLENISSLAAKVQFIPSVEDPVEGLNMLVESQKYEWVKYDSSKLPAKPGVVLRVSLSDADFSEDRPQMLRRHDEFIAKVYSELLAKHSHVIAVFTGKQSSWLEPQINRVRREVEDVNATAQPFLYNTSNIALIYSSNYPSISDGDETLQLKEIPSQVKPDIRDGLLRITIGLQAGVNKVLLRYRFKKQQSSWSLPEIEYETGSEKLMLRSNQDISGKLNSSFTSKGPVQFSNGNVKLTFKDLKVQPWTYSNEFGEAESTDQFFTAPIWSGLFVTFILSLILIWGITMLMDIRTMDRFDDPKGKTISVNVAE